MIKIFLKFIKYFSDTSLRRIYSPFEGNVFPSDRVSNITISSNIIGPSICVIPTANALKAPCNAVVSSISEKKNALAITIGNFELILTVGINPEKYDDSMFRLLVQKDDHVKRGQSLILFDLNRLKEIDNEFMCVMIIKQSRLDKLFSLISNQYVKYKTTLGVINIV